MRPDLHERHARHARHHHRHHRGPPRAWWLAKGIHQTVLLFLVMAVAIGAAAGAALQSAHGLDGAACLGMALLALVWPLAGLATFRIAWPLRKLAGVAEQIRSGDLTRREELPQGPSEVGQLSDAVRGMADRLARQLADQRALMAAVSHELRSPLARARVMIELVREGVAAPSVHDDLQREIDAMDGLVGDLLAAARIDLEAVSPRPLDAVDLALRGLELAGLPAEALVVAGEVGAVSADPTLAARALGVVLDNARRYGGEVVTLTVAEDGGRVRFTVDDDGPGFAPGDEERAFQPFWRGSSGDASRGEGLGLALVRQIAEAHEGAAGAANRPEGGARVWLELPTS